MKETIEHLNEAFSENEKAGNAAFFENHLADDLIFRRANGALATKADFIAGLQGRTWHQLDNHQVAVFFEEKHPDFAVATLLVDYHFTINADGAVKQGCAKNIRFFRLEGEAWKVYAWYNENVEV